MTVDEDTAPPGDVLPKDVLPKDVLIEVRDLHTHFPVPGGWPKVAAGTIAATCSPCRASSSSSRFGSAHQVSGSTSQNSGTSPAHSAACAADAVPNPGISAYCRPGRRTAACFKASIRPVVPLLTASTWPPPKTSVASAASYAALTGP